MPEQLRACVFLGPSLPADRARALIADAIFLPPVRKGDVLRALRYKPNAIAIIDGAFEHTASVWHKEILYAMSLGIRVIGGASMGALRAAELADLGMEGRGRIFDDFYSGRIIADDEVAVLHGPVRNGYKSVTVPLVEVRYALDEAIDAIALDPVAASNILEAGTRFFYKDRTWHDVIVHCVASDPDQEPEYLRFSSWLPVFLSRKSRDAEEVISALLSEQRPLSVKPSGSRSALTEHLRTLIGEVSAACVPLLTDFLGDEERYVFLGRVFPSEYRLLKRLARLTSILGYMPPIKERHGPTARLIEVSDRLGRAEAFTSENGEGTALTERLYLTTAAVWHDIDQALEVRGFTVCDGDLERTERLFRHAHALGSEERYRKWRSTRNLSADDMDALLSLLLRFRIVTSSAAVQGLFAADPELDWICRCAAAVGFTQHVRDALCSSGLQQRLLQSAGSLSDLPLRELRDLDFTYGPPSVENFQRSLAEALS